MVTGAVLAAVCLILGAGLTPPVLVGDRLIEPLTVHLVLVGLIAASVTVVGMWTGRPRRSVRILVWVLGIVAVSLHGLWAGVTTTSYSVLTPPSPSGCRVVVRESAFYMTGEGSIGVAGPRSGPVRLSEDYTVDDGGRPFHEGPSTVTWTPQEWGPWERAEVMAPGVSWGPDAPVLLCLK